MGRPQDDDIELARRAKGGDVDAYAALLRCHQPLARRLALVICGSSGEADDATEDAFVKAWYALERFRDGEPFRPWLLRIVANEARNRRRASGRRAHYELRFAEDRASAEAAPSTEAAVLAATQRDSVRLALTALPAHHRDVVACRHLLGLSEAETAAALGIPIGTVKSRLARGVGRLRVLLGGDELVGREGHDG